MIWTNITSRIHYKLKDKEVSMNNLLDKLNDRKLKRFEKKMRKTKPQLLSKWYAQLDESIHAEYEEEMERLQDQIQDLSRKLKDAQNSRDYYKGKYEGAVEIQDKRELSG